MEKRNVRRKVQRKKRKTGLIIGLSILLIIVGYFAWFFYATWSNVNKITVETNDYGKVDIATKPSVTLLAGLDNYDLSQDSRGDGFRADSLNLAITNPNSGIVDLISIPRDTSVPIACENNKEDKITHSYAFGGKNSTPPEERIKCTITTIQNWLKLKIDNFVIISFHGVVELVNGVGGIDIPVVSLAKSFCEQNSQSNKLNAYCFEQGKLTHMDGDMALSYARHRHSDTDTNRGGRQQQVIKAVLKKMLSPLVVPKIPEITSKISKLVKTTLSVPSLVDFVMKNKNFISNFNSSFLIRHNTIMVKDEMIKGTYYAKVDQASLAEIEYRINDTLGKNTPKELTKKIPADNYDSNKDYNNVNPYSRPDLIKKEK